MTPRFIKVLLGLFVLPVGILVIAFPMVYFGVSPINAIMVGASLGFAGGYYYTDDIIDRVMGRSQ